MDDRFTPLMLHETILAMMLAVAPPGQSAHSVVLEPDCGTNPIKPACDRVPAPKWSPFHQSFVHKETLEEALRRYLVIAKAIEKVAVQMSTPIKRADGTEEPPSWSFGQNDLAQALVTIAQHESGFRRDVHSGVGPAALGDCTYWDQTGQRVPLDRARGTRVTRTSCKSVCLMQLNTGGLERSRFGFVGKEMIGLDEASTERCFVAGARAFAEAQARCAPTRSWDWFARSVTSYGTGALCEKDADWTKARVNTFEKIGKISAATLSKEVRVLLGLDTAGAGAGAGAGTKAGTGQ
jgi:hypothetical protein